MSLIGPRPIVESERCHYSDQEFDLLCSIKPGITGYWQVNGQVIVHIQVVSAKNLNYFM